MTSHYQLRRAESWQDCQRLRDLFTEVFSPEDVGTLAETLFKHHPHTRQEYWFLAEESEHAALAAAFALIPWTWELEGVPLRVAEMGLVGTRKEHRHRGLMTLLNQEFDKTLADDHFDLAVIQGIPGFYQQFGFFYALTLENHISLPLHIIPDTQASGDYTFRRADLKDIPFLIQEDAAYRKAFSLSSVRDNAIWTYLLTESLATEYGSEFWIIERKGTDEKFYWRMPNGGFGTGLIVSEISEAITFAALSSVLVFCKQKAQERQKPYIRLNLHNDSRVGKIAISLGAVPGKPYAWQIKIPHVIRFLKTIAPILEKRMQASSFSHFSGTLRLDMYKSAVDLHWTAGRLVSVEASGKQPCDNTFCLSADLLPALALGHRTWQELQSNRPDIFPASQYTRPTSFLIQEKSALLIDTLFPATQSWCYEQY